MVRKRWTPKTEITEELLRFREKRKWQIALRRYAFEKNSSAAYGPYFGLDIALFRKWIELQFDGEMNWENFSEAWQFDHVVPIGYFEFEKERDLRLCWNFTNIRVEKLKKGAKPAKTTDILAAKAHFSVLWEAGGYAICKEMMERIELIEEQQKVASGSLSGFLQDNKSMINNLATLTPAEYASLNKGMELRQILEERAFLKRYG